MGVFNAVRIKILAETSFISVAQFFCSIEHILTPYFFILKYLLMDIICFSHLRWNFVYQRPQHILGRLAQKFRVFFVEEPVYDTDSPFLDNTISREGVWILVPHIAAEMDDTASSKTIQHLLQRFFNYFEITQYIFWFYTPMALSVSNTFSPMLVIYDCMDELSAFKNAPADLQQKEKELFARADIVFTGGQSLYQAKKELHRCIFAFPSSIDKKHFRKARAPLRDPEDQSSIPHPRIGFFGVIDERMDITLLKTVAEKKPDWNFILLGPTVKIDPSTLPTLPNVYYLGSKVYNQLPDYLAGWDVAMMPFAINESTKYISPTKTPEYLAGGKPVVSTPIQDVVNPYGLNGLVYIAGNGDEFITGIEEELMMVDKQKWLKAVDKFLEKSSWEDTVEEMLYIINTKLEVTPLTSSQKHEKKYV